METAIAWGIRFNFNTEELSLCDKIESDNGKNVLDEVRDFFPCVADDFPDCEFLVVGNIRAKYNFYLAKHKMFSSDHDSFEVWEQKREKRLTEDTANASK